MFMRMEGIAVDVDDQLVPLRELRADGGGQAESPWCP
jgi:hypothetical protein